MGKTIRTVCGKIAPEALGFTTMHEHTIADMTQLITAQQAFKDMIPPFLLKAVPENMALLTLLSGLR